MTEVANAVEPLPPSCGPASDLPDETLVDVLLASAGRLVRTESEAQFDRVHECRAELVRRLAELRLLGGQPAPSGPVIKSDFDRAFRTACRKNRARAAYVLAEHRPGADQPLVVIGGDPSIQKAIRHAFAAAGAKGAAPE
jgi:hypothetical protein